MADTAHAAPPRPLTPMQQRFCELIAGGTNQSKAFRIAYHAENRTAKDVREKARILCRSERIMERIAEIRAPVIEQAQYGLRHAMDEAEEALDLARTTRQPSAMVSAVALRAKLNGLLVEDRQNNRTAYEGMSDADLARAERETDAAIAIARGQVPAGAEAGASGRAEATGAKA